MKYKVTIVNKEFIYIGKIVNTHGIKGELRILSDFEKKERIFIPAFPIYIGKTKIKEIIKTYRHHKTFEMITLENYSNINEVLKYKGLDVYIKREDMHLKPDEYLYEDLIGLQVYEENKKIGKIDNIVYNKLNILLHIKAAKEFYIPLNSEFIKKVNLKEAKMEVKNVKGLII